ncbi:MetQ/NlpA family ABC transporter substrate-binding protein [Ruoffia tabacinasalis]|jgi:D-methionine transport system substrate-binding protein|uniref:MetQ/NlpA family ABC transporter substrate-binding protein n=1 Tax=Ruoffia tabacinasalis TaxID=87458 RepID=A0ABS0LIJ3_9LACT|nr:MetQ/NlpA family ABC transporter substrate-binding protein [Ruoffia tabacinasalis]MBG9978105.1 MetQ/NlpA family ABC transporter substrate-binding protein [Ruoffia tabacinasalis]
MKKFFKSLGVLSLAGSVLVGATSAVQAQGEFEGETVTVGVVSEAEEQVWEFVSEQALEQEGIELELVLFTDYVQPNVALQDGSTDLNAFQHVAFLNEWNEANDGNLEALGFSYVTPLGVYSESITSIEEIPEDAVIAIPNDPTNGGRALLGLELAGLIEVDDEAGILPTVADVTDNPLNIQFEELEAAQIAQALPDVDAAVINNTFALDAGLSVEDAIFLDAENPADLPDDYKNIIAVNGDNADSELFAKVVELYQTDEVAEKLAEASNGGDVPAWTEEGEEESDSSESEETTEESEESEESAE